MYVLWFLQSFTLYIWFSLKKVMYIQNMLNSKIIQKNYYLARVHCLDFCTELYV